jgi:hypothetical protein
MVQDQGAMPVTHILLMMAMVMVMLAMTVMMLMMAMAMMIMMMAMAMMIMMMAMAMMIMMMAMAMMIMMMAMAKTMMMAMVILRPLCRLGTGRMMYAGAILVDHPSGGKETPDDWKVIASPLHELPLLLSRSSRTVVQSL